MDVTVTGGNNENPITSDPKLTDPPVITNESKQNFTIQRLNL